MSYMEDIGARLRAEVDALVAQMGGDADTNYAALMERYNERMKDEKAASEYSAGIPADAMNPPVDLEKYDFGYFNGPTGAGNAIIDGEVADRD